MLNFAKFFGKHEIDEWRDEHTLVAAAIMNQAAADLILMMERELEAASWKDELIGQSAFIASHVAPAVREAVQPVVTRIVADANQALGRIVAVQAVWHDRPQAAEAVDRAFEGWHDVASAAAPLAGGAALAAAVPTAAITTTTAWFGLVSVTAISWPIVVGGGAVAGAFVATGMFNTARIRSKARARLRRKVRDYVVGALIEGSSKSPSILTQLRDTYDRAAELAKEA